MCTTHTTWKQNKNTHHECTLCTRIQNTTQKHTLWMHNINTRPKPLCINNAYAHTVNTHQNTHREHTPWEHTVDTHYKHIVNTHCKHTHTIDTNQEYIMWTHTLCTRRAHTLAWMASTVHNHSLLLLFLQRSACRPAISRLRYYHLIIVCMLFLQTARQSLSRPPRLWTFPVFWL